MYSKNLIVHKGVDNVLLFEFLNQDQKPVNISGSTFTFRLLDSNGQEILLAKDMVILHAGKGRAKVVLAESDIDSITAKIASYTIERSSGILNEAVFVDSYSDGRGTVDIVDSVYPAFVPSIEVTVPDQSAGIQYTSLIESTSLSTTFQYTLSNFIGTIYVQGTVDPAGPWYDITQTVYATASTLSDFDVIVGAHPYIRIGIETTQGTVESIRYR